MTETGKECQRWTSQHPHNHDRTPENEPDLGLGPHNFCRNPDGVAAPWCYTMDPKERWEYCDVCNQGEKSTSYSGTWHTATGSHLLQKKKKKNLDGLKMFFVCVKSKNGFNVLTNHSKRSVPAYGSESLGIYHIYYSIFW